MGYRRLGWEMGQICRSLNDYRSGKCAYGGRRRHGGILITCGPTENIEKISIEIRKAHSKEGERLRQCFEENKETRFFNENGYDERTLELYGIQKGTDGASNFCDGYLTAIKRFILGVDKEDMGLESELGEDYITYGARHMAARHASRFGLLACALSEETGNITVFRDGLPVMVDSLRNPLADCIA